MSLSLGILGAASGSGSLAEAAATGQLFSVTGSADFGTRPRRQHVREGTEPISQQGPSQHEPALLPAQTWARPDSGCRGHRRARERNEQSGENRREGGREREMVRVGRGQCHLD